MEPKGPDKRAVDALVPGSIQSMIQSDVLTFDDGLGTGIVDLLLVGVWRQDPVEHVGLSLQTTNTHGHTWSHMVTHGH